MRSSRRNVMNAVKVSRLELLEIVRKNKEQHIKDFNESVKDFKKAVVKVTKENLDLAKSGDLEKIGSIKAVPPKPVSYETSYARAARMLELSVEDVIEVEEDVFNQLVLDEWDWKHQFITSNTLYKSF
jgi:predicted nucleic acid-binding OB-fold protein